MAVNRSQRVRLGAFLVIAVSLLFGLLVLVIGEQLLQDRYRYYVDFTDTRVTGLRVGSSVLYNGIEVGTVADTGFADNSVEQVVVTIMLDRDVPIKADARARLTPVGITGNMRIELVGATNEAETLEAGARIPATGSTFQMLSEPVNEVANELVVLLERANDLFGEANRGAVTSSIASIETVLADNREPITRIIANLDSLLDAEAATLADTISEFNTTSRRLASSAEAVERSLTGPDGATEIVRRLGRTLEQADAGIQRIEGAVVDTEGEVLNSLDLLAETLEYLNVFAAKISEDPSELVR